MKAKQSELALLRLVAAAGGSIAGTDDRLEPFDFDGEPDSIDNCLALGWLKLSRAGGGEGTLQLTPDGRQMIEAQP